MAIWRIHIKTAARLGQDPRQYCISNNIVGFGWGVSNFPKDLDQYKLLGQQQYEVNGDKSWRSAVNALGDRMKMGDLCWTRTMQGVYFLGKIDGNWEYQSGTDADNFDVYNVRKCLWVEVGLVDAVPGEVERAFVPSRTLQQMTDQTIGMFSEYLYAKLTGGQVKATNCHPDIFSLLSPLEHEDLAALYLQIEHGYVLIPSSAKSSTAAYECVFTHLQKPKAVIQVKSGNAYLDVATLPASGDLSVFIVSSDGAIEGTVPKNVQFIARDTLLTFAKQHKDILPDRIKRYMDWAGI